MRGVRFDSKVVLVVVGLACGVGAFFVLPRFRAQNVIDGRDSALIEASSPDAVSAAPADVAMHEVSLPSRSVAEIIVLTDLPDARIDAALAHLGDFANASLAAFFASHEFRSERRPRSEIQLPRAEVMDEIAPTLSPDERTRALNAKWAVTVHAGAPRDRANLPLRAVLDAGSSFGKMDKSGSTWIYDVANRRIESGEDFARRADVPKNFSTSLLRADRLFVHRYDDPDADAGGAVRTRLMTLGLKAFALPDLTIGPCDPADAPAFAALLHDVATTLDGLDPALTKTRSPLRVGAGHVSVDLRPAPRREGDPENILYLVVPLDPVPVIAEAKAPVAEERAAIEKASAKAAQTLPQALMAWKRAPGSTLQVAAPFRNADAGVDAPREFMWLTVDAADPATLTGRLANQPVIVTSLTAGSLVHVARSDVFDWLLRLPDGTTTESKTAPSPP